MCAYICCYCLCVTKRTLVCFSHLSGGELMHLKVSCRQNTSIERWLLKMGQQLKDICFCNKRYFLIFSICLHFCKAREGSFVVLILGCGSHLLCWMESFRETKKSNGKLFFSCFCSSDFWLRKLWNQLKLCVILFNIKVELKELKCFKRVIKVLKWIKVLKRVSFNKNHCFIYKIIN